MDAFFLTIPGEGNGYVASTRSIGKIYNMLDNPKYGLMTVSYTHLDVYKRQVYIEDAPQCGVCLLLIGDIAGHVQQDSYNGAGECHSNLLAEGCLLYTSRCV